MKLSQFSMMNYMSFSNLKTKLKFVPVLQLRTMLLNWKKTKQQLIDHYQMKQKISSL